MKICVHCLSATVFYTSLVSILAKFVHKLVTSEKALTKRMSTARLPLYFRESIICLWPEREKITSIVEILRSEGVGQLDFAGRNLAAQKRIIVEEALQKSLQKWQDSWKRS